MLKKDSRFYVFDLLRGTAVFLMLIAHAVYFFHNSTSPGLLRLEKIGNTVCFVTFLLVSGAVSYIAYLSKEDLSLVKKKLIKRTIMLLGAYYALALFVLASQISTNYGFKKIALIFDVLLFRNTPSYTEYFPPFLFFGLLLFIFGDFFKAVLKKGWMVLALAVSVYFGGQIIYGLAVPGFIAPWKAFLVGSEGYYRFPVLQYFPVFFLGLYWGRVALEAKVIKDKVNFSKIATFISLVVLIVSAIYSIVVFSGLNFLALRWPPSIGFIFVGLLFAFALSLLFYKSNQLKKIPLIRDFLLLFGQNAFSIFWAHVFLLQLYQMSGGTKVGSVFAFFVLFTLITILSLALATFVPFNFRLGLNMVRGCREEDLGKETIYRLTEEIYEDATKEIGFLKNFFFPPPRAGAGGRKFVRKRHMAALGLVALVISFVFFPSLIQERDKKVKSLQTQSWWSDEYMYYQPIIVKNLESFSDLETERVVRFSFDHQELVGRKKSMPKGEDIRVVYWGGEKFDDLSYWLENSWNKNDTTISFNLKDSIPPGQEVKNLFLYYGNFAATPKNVSIQKPKDWRYKYEIKTDAEVAFPNMLQVGRLWNIKDSELITQRDLHLSFFGDNNFSTSANVDYEILKTKIKGRLDITDGGTWEGLVQVKDLAPGVYQAQATIKDEGITYKSQKVAFYVTYPLYVTWSQDWEGYDVWQPYLEAMASIADKYGMPQTHLFNPRIYTSGALSVERQNYLTNWVKQRSASRGEDIGLHLHMFYDLVRDAGLEPKFDPNWGDSGDGYGVLTSNYSEAEMVKILERSLWWFEKNNLPKPISFRAGGWFANEETLKALDSLGFKIDSSGRTKYEFGKNKIKGHWDLDITTQPYKPSRTNQNQTGPDHLNIWQVPNNGGDTYWFKSPELIHRFNLNYPGVILKEKKNVDFLSHPHWFNRAEQDRVEDVLSHVSNFKNDKDLGPVIFTTFSGLYADWLGK